jgi:hypothetical protein
MQTKFKRGDRVVLLADPDPEYIEYHNEDDPDFKEIPVKKGMLGKINMMLSNGKYHVEVLDKSGEILAYVPMDEDDLGKEN